MNLVSKGNIKYKVKRVGLKWNLYTSYAGKEYNLGGNSASLTDLLARLEKIGVVPVDY
jgi:hypothetical protein